MYIVRPSSNVCRANACRSRVDLRTLYDEIQRQFEADNLSGGYLSNSSMVSAISFSRSRGFGSLLRIECIISGSSGSISSSSVLRDITICGKLAA